MSDNQEKQVFYVRGMKVTFEKDTKEVKLPQDLQKRLAHSIWHWLDDDWLESLKPVKRGRFLYGSDDPDASGPLSPVQPLPEPERSVQVQAYLLDSLHQIRKVIEGGDVPQGHSN